MSDAPERIWIDAAGGHWSPVAGGTHEIEYIRADRTVTLPAKTQDVIAWDRLPDWVQWVARDEGGEVWGYDEEPEYRVDGWVFESTIARIDDFPGIVVQIGTCDWTESKQRRPQK